MNNFSELKSLLEKGLAIGLNLKSQIKKIEQIIEALNNDTIKIVLLGSFSDGKTSVVAGMLGKVLNNMKIDIDESSDELTFYRTDFLGKGFEIVDTPGLFGTKEKEINGENIRFSDTTRKYISEAHIVLYVCDAVVPLRESHVPVLKTVLKTFNKLESTIFVINKMDATGIRLKDEEDFNRMSEIKKENLKGCLKSELKLTDSECNHLNIVCVAADPKGKGLEYWFTKIEDYKLRSHIDLAINMVKNVAQAADKEELKSNANKAAAKDIALQVTRELHYQISPLSDVISNGKENLNILKEDFNHFKQDIQTNRSTAKDRILKLQNKMVSQIDSANISTIGHILSEEYGIEDEQATGYILLSKIDSILSECSEANNASITIIANKMEKFVTQQNNFAREAITKGVAWAAKQQVTGKMVLAFRNEFLKGLVKFKPWGAIKLAGNITKWAGRISGLLTIGFIVYDIWKKYDNDKKLIEAQNSLKEALNSCIKNILELLNDDKSYYNNFAPSYYTLCKQFEEQEQLNKENKETLDQFNHYSDNLKKWLTNSGIEDVDFEEIPDDVTF